MAKPKWVRGKALQTVLALKALQEGDALLTPVVDRIVFKRAKTAYVIKDSGGLCVQCPCSLGCGVTIPLDQVKIIGWRRVVDK